MRRALRSRLLANATVAGLVGVRVYNMDTRPQGGALPAVTIRQISGERQYTHDAVGRLVDGRAEINCYGANGADAVALATAVRRAIEGAGFTADTETVQSVFLLSEQDFTGEAEAAGVRVFRVMLDFQVWYQEV
jgi:hypothetical protein